MTVQRSVECRLIGTNKYRVVARNGQECPVLCLSRKRLSALADGWKSGRGDDPVSQSFSRGTLAEIGAGIEEMIATRQPSWTL